MASLGNITENPHVGLLFIDFFESTIGLHVNGEASIVENDELQDRYPSLARALADAADRDGRRPERWVIVTVVEAYIHCSKHIPLLRRLDKEIRWGTDDARQKGGDYFHVKHLDRPWRHATPPGEGLERREPLDV